MYSHKLIKVKDINVYRNIEHAYYKCISRDRSGSDE